MLKVKVSGTLNELKRSQKLLKRAKSARIRAISEPVQNKRSEKYKHYYADVELI